MAQRLNLSVELGKKRHSGDGGSADSQQLKFILLGCFSGTRNSSDSHANTHQGLRQVDLDNFDALLSEIQPSLKIRLSDQAEPLQLSFTSLDDFHPDQLHQQLPQQQSPSSDVRREQQPANPRQSTSTRDQQESDQQTLSRLLGKGSVTTPSASGSQANRTLVESVVGRLIDGSLKREGPEDTEQETDHSGPQRSLLKRVIHHPEFQALESNWRGLDWLVRSLESDELNTVFIFDMASDEWDLFSQDELDFPKSDCYRSLLERFSNDHPSEQKFILICDKYFNSSSGDIRLLESLSLLGRSLNAQLIAASSATLLSESDSDPDSMNQLKAFQQSEAAANVSLVLPRILMRMPYGEQYDPVESFDFEELDTEWSNDELLWGNPGYALAIQLAADNQSDQQQDAVALADCPSFAYRKNSESHLQPCTESLFTDLQLETLVELGMVPIVGSRRSNVVKIPWYRRL